MSHPLAHHEGSVNRAMDWQDRFTLALGKRDTLDIVTTQKQTTCNTDELPLETAFNLGFGIFNSRALLQPLGTTRDVPQLRRLGFQDISQHDITHASAGTST